MDTGLVDCPRCGRAQSAWEDRYCGRCEEKFQKEQAEYIEGLRHDLQSKADERNREYMAKTGDEFGPYYVTKDELGEPYLARGEI